MRVVALLGLFLAAAAGAQQMYRWTDEQGRAHVTDTPPPKGAKNVQKKAVPSGGPASEAEPYAVQVARQKNPITLYTMPRDCDACGQARKLLNDRGVPFTEVSVETNKQIEELKQAVGSNSVPALVVGDAVQKGFEPGAYHSALDAAGYPKQGVLPPRRQPDPKAEERKAEKAPPAPEAPRGPYAPR